jgi:Flp pilus assembly pilin Flp
MTKKVQSPIRRATQKGAALVEYGLLIAGVALIAAVSVSIFGNKTADLIAAVATVLPGSSGSDNLPIVNGQLLETVSTASGSTTYNGGSASTGWVLNVTAIATRSDGTYSRLNDVYSSDSQTVTGIPQLVLQNGYRPAPLVP